MMQGCSTLETHTSKNPPVVSQYVMQPCSKLIPPENGSFPEIAGKLVETVGDYKICAEKQKALRDTVKAYENYLKKDSLNK